MMKKIPDAVIQEIRLHTDIVSVINRYVQLEQRGKRWVGLCPFHNEKTPSFGVQPEQGFFYCFGCKKGGDAITFIKEIENCQYIEAVERLAEFAGITITYEGDDDPAELRRIQERNSLLELYDKLTGTFHYMLLNSAKARHALAYIESRGFKLETIKRFKLGFVPADRGWLFSFLQSKAYSKEFLAKSGLFSAKYPDFCIFNGRLVFPITDIKNRTIAFGGRDLADRGPKYINSPETVLFRKHETLFGFSLAQPAIRTYKKAIVCEGYMDVLAFVDAGIDYAVAPLGTAFTEEQINLLKRNADHLYLCFDSDSAGRKATMRAITLTDSVGVDISVMNLPDAKDPAEILQKFGDQQLKLSLESIINKDDYILSQAHALRMADGDKEAFSFLFSYICSLKSEISKDRLLERMAGSFGLDPYSVMADYKRYCSTNQQQKVDKTVVGADPETRLICTHDHGLIIALILNPEYFEKVRGELKPEDFEEKILKDAFIVLEDSYRKGTLTTDAVMELLASPALKTLIMEKAANGDYQSNQEQVIKDGMFRLLLHRLEQKKVKLVNQIRSYNPARDADEISMNDLLYEKMHLDDELARLKEERHERH